MKIFLRFSFLVFFLLIFFGFNIADTHAATLYVNYGSGNDTTGDGSSGNPYKTFHKGYTMATAGDTLDLTGTFTWSNADETGDASTSGYTLGKNLTLAGHGPSQTIIQSSATDNTADRRVFTLSAGFTFNFNNLAIRYGRTSATGGGIWVGGTTTLNINQSEIYSCRSTSNGGGGVFNMGTTTINDSAIYYNYAAFVGGGLYSYNASGLATLVVTNSTIYSNQNNGGWNTGGGIHIQTGNATITNCTITANYTSGSGGGISSYDSASLNIYLKNNIIAGNTAVNSTKDIYLSSGIITNGGYNVYGTSYGISATAGDWTDSDGNGTYNLYSVGTTGQPNLDSAASINDNSSGTHTWAIRTGSIATNNGSSNANNGINIPANDQRGATRSGATDIGSYELGGSGLTITAPTTQASGINMTDIQYKRMTINWTNGNGMRRVVFAKQGSSGTANPSDGTSYSVNTVFGSGDQIGSSGWYAIYDGLGTSVTLTGLTPSTDYIFQVFEYNGVDPSKADYLTDTATNNPKVQASYTPITKYINSGSGNDSTGDGTSGNPYKTFHKGYTMANPGDTIDATGTFTWTSADETGDASNTGYTISRDLNIVGHNADQTIFQAAAADNTADRRVFEVNEGYTVTFSNLAIRYGKSGNYSGGGVYVYGGANATLTHVEIYNCRNTGSGAGISNAGTTTIKNSAIYSNVTSGEGGGIINYRWNGTATLTLTDSTVYSNQQTGGWNAGGGIHIRSGTATITNSTITKNSAVSSGGGIYVYDSSVSPTLYLKNTIIVENISSNSYKNVYKQSGSLVNNGYNALGSSYGISTTTGDWYDNDNDGTFSLYSVGTTGSLNLDASASINGSSNGTKTYAILAGSLAANNASSSANNSVSISSSDQRGFFRNGNPDIGAYEYEGSATDITAPLTSSLSPVDEATNINASSNLVINFNEDVVVKSGTENDVVIKKLADGSIVESIDAESTNITGSGSSAITINPTNNLTDNTSYYVQIGADTFDDEAGNSFAGITNNSTWNFTTGDFTPPTITSVFSDKTNGAYKSGQIIDIDVTFSEAVTSTGNVTVTLETGDTDRTCTFSISNSTTGTCNYTVQAGDTAADLEATISGTIKDQANNTLTNFTPATTLATSKDFAIDTAAPSTPIASPTAGTYTSVQTVSLSSTGSSAIYYTVNSDTPTTGSTLYSSAIAVNNSQTIKALAIDTAGNESTILTAEYILNLDSNAPTISNVSVNPSSESAAITWTTNENSSSQVEYGLVSTYGNTTSETDTSARVTNHSVALNDLKSCAKYFYRVKSKDSYDNQGVSNQNVFYTTGCTVSSITASNGDQLNNSGGSLSLSTNLGSATLNAPASFFNQSVYLQINRLGESSAPSGPEEKTLIADNFFKLLAVAEDGNIVSNFNQPITFTVNYGSSIEDTYLEDSLDVYKYINGAWEKKNCTLDKSANTLTCSLSNFSIYGVLGETIPDEEEEIDSNLPVVAIGDNQIKNLSQTESVSLKKRTFVFRGKNVDFPAGTIVKIYKSGKKVAQKRVNSKNNWRYQSKQKSKLSDYQFKYVNKKTGEILHSSDQYQILVDKTKPRFTQFQKSATVRKGNTFSWRATDDDSVKYYLVRFQGKNYTTNEPNFAIPNNAKSKVSRIVVTVFDRAENRETKEAMLKIKKID